MINVKRFKWLLISFIVISIVGYGICVSSVLVTIFQTDLIDRPICLNTDCLARFVKEVEPALAFGKATSDLVVAIATTGGIVIALWSYFHAVSNSALGNHISHFSIFQSYLNSEINKRNRVNLVSVDTFHWYNLIFPTSKSGLLIVSGKYKKCIHEINLQIIDSNSRATTASGESFRYKPHQAEMKERLKDIGINISMQPRIEYYEIEDQLMSLITCINNSFCLEADIPALNIRKYS